MENKEIKLSFAQFLSVLRWLILYSIKIVPGRAVARVITSTLNTLSPLINAYIFAQLLDRIIEIAATGTDPGEIVPMLLVLLGYNIANSGINYLNGYLGTAMGVVIQQRSPIILYSHMASLGIQTLENPDVVNKIQRAREVLMALSGDFERTILFFARIITLTVAAFVVVKMMPLVVAIIFISMIPGFVSNKYFMRKDWKLYRDETENRRKANSAAAALMETSNLQEITITSASGYLGDIYKKFVDRYVTAELRIIRTWDSLGFLLGSIKEIASIFGYFTILKNLFNKLISVGDATFQMRSLDIFVSNLSVVMSSYANLYERCIRINEVKEVFDMKPMISDGVVDMGTAEQAPVIEFKGVSFKYPNAKRYVINNLDLVIRPGERIAIVGENGAGKTTLVKLLSRFYKVGKGSIRLNGTNINDIKIESWYRNLGVLFQDYNTYASLTLKENILLGDAHREFDAVRMELAANKANVSSFIADYGKGYDQVLSEKFKGGTRPSTGQWQKIAIARFFYRNSPVVIFDEPTASIDAVSEAEIFGQIYEFFKDKTVIIISHRFSTVRNADRIYVVDGGAIVESGNHGELMQKKGKYHRAFTIQAEGYK